MSSKVTILLSDANEHWYKDCNKNDDFILEFGDDVVSLIPNEGQFEITIHKGSSLWKAFDDLLEGRHKNGD